VRVNIREGYKACAPKGLRSSAQGFNQVKTLGFWSPFREVICTAHGRPPDRSHELIAGEFRCHSLHRSQISKDL